MDNGLNCFGGTTNIINGGQECGQGAESYGSQHRMDYYIEWLNFFGLEAEDATASCMGCGGQQNLFPDAGSAYIPSYFDNSWSGDPTCKLVPWQTGYSLYVRDDYKRCVCDLHGQGATDCPTDPNPAPTPNPDPIPDPDDIDDDVEYDFGVQCTNPTDGLCGQDCTTGCFWSWPTSDADGCMSQDAACRCKPAPLVEYTYINLCVGQCEAGCNICTMSWPSHDDLKLESQDAMCRCADGANNWYPA